MSNRIISIIIVGSGVLKGIPCSMARRSSPCTLLVQRLALKIIGKHFGVFKIVELFEKLLQLSANQANGG